MFLSSQMSSRGSGSISDWNWLFASGESMMPLLISAGAAFAAALVIYITVVQMKKRPNNAFVNWL